MKIIRQDLIELCDKFLSSIIDKKTIQNFAWNYINSEEIEFEEDEIIKTTIFEWDNEEIDFPINNINILLWKERLLTGNDKLLEYNHWNFHIEKQKETCLKYNSKWTPINKKLRIGASTNLNLNPINGLKHPTEKGTTGWFIWTGEYSSNDDFFQPMCAEHLLQIRPEIIKYLALDIGFRFLIDNKGYEDVWHDEKLTEV